LSFLKTKSPHGLCTKISHEHERKTVMERVYILSVIDRGDFNRTVHYSVHSSRENAHWYAENVIEPQLPMEALGDTYETFVVQHDIVDVQSIRNF